jgi:hypothetical protein
MHVRAAVIALSAGCVACTPSKERTEAEAVLSAVHEMREATPDQRDAPLAALDRLETAEAEAAEVKVACVAAYRPQQKARELMAQIQKAVDQDAAAIEHGALLLEAETLLAESEAKLPACEEAILALRRVHRL